MSDNDSPLLAVAQVAETLADHKHVTDVTFETFGSDGSVALEVETDGFIPDVEITDWVAEDPENRRLANSINTGDHGEFHLVDNRDRS